MKRIEMIFDIRKTATFMIVALISACSGKQPLSPEEVNAYEKQIDTWHAKRIERVKAADGWLNLVGLYWLEPGVNTFGSGEKNNIVFPKDKIAEQAGHFILQGNTVSIFVNRGVSIALNGRPVSEQVIFHTDSTKAVVLTSGSLEWNIIKRDSKFGIRLRDHESEALKTFKGVDRFSVDPDYRVQSVFEKSADSSRTIPITNVLGQTTPQSSPGTLVFELQGKKQRLDVLKGNDKEFFVIFADATSGKETYGGGRFIYVKKPVADEAVYIDFNKAYNPPCVFTPYATCPLPPKQNELSVAVEAGEKNFK